MLTLLTSLAFAASSWLDHVPPKDHARPSPLASNPDAVHAGALLYKQHCAQCHQPDAAGDGKKKPSLKTDRIRSASDGDLEWYLRQGDLAHGMPSWSSLPQGQRWQIIAWLRSLQYRRPLSGGPVVKPRSGLAAQSRALAFARKLQRSMHTVAER